jgi:hypothetical protein
MTATSNPPAELPALGAGCEGDFSQQLVLPRPPRTAKNFTALMKTKLDGQVQETYNTAAHALDPTLAADHKAPLPARLPDDVVTDAFLRVGCYMASVSLARNRPSAPFAAARSFRRLLSAAVVVPPSFGGRTRARNVA